MADMGGDVYITGADFGGDLPQWATETTAVSMAAALAELVEITDKQQQKLVDQLKKNGEATKEVAETIGKKGVAGSLKEDLAKVSDEALDTAAGFDKVNKHMPGFGKYLKEMPKSLKLGLAGFGGLVAGMTYAIDIIRNTAGVMKDMNDSGIIVEGGIRELQHSLAQTGMTLDQLSSITEKYSRVVGTNGWKAITSLTASVNEADGGFRKYGITTAEATEFTAEYLDQQRMAGVFGAASQRGQSKALQENVERLTAYSKTLNVSRKAMMDSVTALKGREDVQAAFALMSVEERKAASAAFDATIQGFASLGPAGEKFGSMLTDMIANPTAEASESFKAIAAAAPDLAQDLVSMSKRVKAGEKISQEEIMTTLEKAGNNKEVLKQLKRAGGEIGAMADSILVASLARENAEKNEAINKEKFSKESEEIQSKGYEAWLATSGEAIQGVTGVDDAMAKLHATIEEQVSGAFLDLVGDEGGQGVKGLIAGIDKMTEMIGMFDDSGIVKNFRALFGEGVPGLLGALGTLSAVILLGPYALVNLPAIITKVGTSFKSVFTGLFGKESMFAKGLTRLGGQLSKSVTSLGGWGKALGKGSLVAGAAYAGWKVGSEIYKRNAVGIQDKLAEWFPHDKGDQPDYASGKVDFKTGKVRTADEQKLHEEMRAKRRAEAASVAATSSATGAPSQTPPEAAPSMSDADIAKLDVAGQQLYYAKRMVRLMEASGGMMA